MEKELTIVILVSAVVSALVTFGGLKLERWLSGDLRIGSIKEEEYDEIMHRTEAKRKPTVITEQDEYQKEKDEGHA